MNQRQIKRGVRFVILLAVVLTMGTFLNRCEQYRIPEPDQSLAPTYNGGSRVICEVLDPDEELARGMDVVYAVHIEGTTYARFGRVRGLPGDTIEVDADGLLTCNGERIGPIALRGDPMGVVPPDRVLVLAVNPQEVTYPDSRALGFIPRADVKGRIVARMAFGD